MGALGWVKGTVGKLPVPVLLQNGDEACKAAAAAPDALILRCTNLTLHGERRRWSSARRRRCWTPCM